MSNPGAWSMSNSLWRPGQPQYYTAQIAWINGGKPYQVSWAFDGNFTDTVTRTGYRTPNYWGLKKRRAYIPPAMASLNLFKGERAVLNLYQTVAGGWQQISGGRVWSTWEEQNGYGSTWLNGSYNMVSANAISNTQQRAQKNMFNKTRDSAFEGLVFAGELGESVRMISNRSSALAEGIQQAYDHATLRRKTDWFDPLYQYRKYGKRPTKTSLGKLIASKANYWLENCYGWSPLVNDIQAGAKAAADYVYKKNGGSVSQESRGHASVEDQFSFTRYGIAFSPFTGGTCVVTRKEKHEHKYGCLKSMAAAMNPSQFHSFASATNLDWRRIAPAAWELIPYSFVVDSFTNVGDIVSSLCTDTSNLYGGWLVSIKEVEITKTYTFPSGGGSPQKYRIVSFFRSGWNINYEPQLTFHTPSAMGAANLTALALSKVRALEPLLNVLF